MEGLLGEAGWAAVWLSVKVGLGCVALGLVPGVALGWLLARRQFWGKGLLDGLVHLPLVLPPVVTGYLLLLVFGRTGLLGPALESIGLRLAFSTTGAVIASTVVAFPLLVRSVRLAIELVDPELEQASLSLGASPLRTFFQVTFPLAIPGVLTGVVLAFARSLGEFGATITFAGNIEGETRTLPLAIFTHYQQIDSEEMVFRLALVSVLLSLGALVCSEAMARRARRKMGAVP